MTILLLYTSLISITKIINVEMPPLTQYSQLYSTYSQTLTCTCTKISINHDKFLHIDYTLHQVCSSIFVDPAWIDYLSTSIGSAAYRYEIRTRSLSAFQALRIFCKLINSTISDSLTEFDSRQYVNTFLKPKNLFEPEIKSLTDQFRLSMRNSFLWSLSMIRDPTQANALFSGLLTNYILYVTDKDGQVEARNIVYSSCSCTSSSTCIYPYAIYDYAKPTPVFDVPGFYTGCFVIESLLQSTLECFYDQNCIDALQVSFSSSSPMKVSALNSSLPSSYSEHSTIKDLVDNLMIEQWNASPIYEKYYNQCQPTRCTYTVKTRNDVIYIVTTLFGIAGGLITALELILPRLVKIIRKKRQHPRPTTGKTNMRMTRCMKLNFEVLRENRLVLRR